VGVGVKHAPPVSRSNVVMRSEYADPNEKEDLRKVTCSAISPYLSISAIHTTDQLWTWHLLSCRCVYLRHVHASE
jgi:hypothetical protein